MAEEQPEGGQPVQDEAAVEMIHEEPPSEDEEVDPSGTACHLVHPAGFGVVDTGCERRVVGEETLKNEAALSKHGLEFR